MNLHLTLQGKGGVGKTLVTTMIAQYLLSKGTPPFCLDTDPVNESFAKFKKLEVHPFDIMKGDKVDNRKFDDLVKMIIEQENDCVMDNGAASFIPVTSYLKENNVLQYLSENGITIFIHVVITGGQSFTETIKGLEYIISNFGEFVHVVVWLNGYFGEIEREGKSFEEFKLFKNNKDKIYGLIVIPEKTRETFGVDIQKMLEDRITCDEYIEASEQYFIMPRQRIKIFKEEMFNNISMVFDHGH